MSITRVLVKDDSGVERPLIVTRHTADACVRAGHFIRHMDGENYRCDDCSSATQFFWHHDTYRRTTCLVFPLEVWANHTHKLKTLGFDGSDWHYVCAICGIESHAHNYYARQQRLEAMRP